MNGLPELSLDHITENTVMGGNLLGAGLGATFRVWAPSAREVRVLWNFTKDPGGSWNHGSAAKLRQMGGGMWGGFVPGLKDGDRYMFYVVGPRGGTEGSKRDPYARDLTDDPGWPECQCFLCDPNAFPWHDQGFKLPPFNELTIYQLHIRKETNRAGNK